MKPEGPGVAWKFEEAMTILFSTPNPKKKQRVCAELLIALMDLPHGHCASRNFRGHHLLKCAAHVEPSIRAK
jgi:hypothetical protein